MSISKKFIGLGIMAILAVAGIVAWQRGGGHAPLKDKPPCHDSNCPAGKHKEEDGCSPKEAAAGPDLKEIENKLCEHNIRQIDCQECRYELGVVKVAPSVTGALTKTAAVEEGDSGAILHLTGEICYDQTTLVDVLPAAAGKVIGVKAHLGQKVQAGDVLAILHSSDFGEAKAAYLEAFAAAETARQEKKRQSAIASVLEKLLANGKAPSDSGIPAEALGEWKSKLVNATARLRQAKTILEREKTLVNKQASSQAELETAEREMQAAQADYTALIEELQIERFKAENAARLAEARLSAAEQRLHLFGIDDEAIKAIPQMKDNGRFACLEVKAPRAGTVIARQAAENQFVEPSHRLYSIADTSNLWVWCDLYERDLGPLHQRLAKGNKPQAQIKVTAFAETFPGQVDLLDSAVNETTRTIKLRVQVKNEAGKLRPGMFAAVDVPLAEGKKAALVPRQAILSDEGRTFVFVHWKEDLWMRRDVTVGRPQGERVEIVGGLSVGEKVVASGGFLFKSDILRAKMGAGCAD